MKLSFASHRVQLLVVLCGALAIRLAAAAWWQARLPDQARFAFGDSESYWELARCIANTEPYQFHSPEASVFRMPGYPLLLATVFIVAGDDPPIILARGLSALCGTLAVAGVYGLGCRLFDGRTALIAAAMAAVYPGAIGLSVFVLSEAPFCPLILAQLTLATASWQAQGRRAVALSAGSGAISGLATLMRPGWLLFVPFSVLVGACFGSHRKRHLVLGLAASAGLIVPLVPWWIRNGLVVGHFVPTTLQVGASLYDGLNPSADGSSRMDFVAGYVVQESAHPDGHLDFEYRLDRRLRQESLSWAVSHPRRVLELAATKFARMWNIWPSGGENAGWPVRLVTAAAYIPVLVLAVFGGWKYRAMGWPCLLCWLPALYLGLLHLVFVSSIRYREPAMLPLLVLAAAALRKGPLRSRSA